MADRTVFDRVKGLSPQGVLLSGVVFGVILIVLSFPLNIDSVTITKDGVSRQVGYVAALNWSIVYTIVFPLFVYFALSAIQSTDTSLPWLNRMLVEKNGKPDSDGAEGVARRYRKLLKQSGKIAVVLASLAVIGSIGEWVAFSAMPLLAGADVPEGEIDWSVAALGDTLGRRLANAAFTLAAFTIQGIYIGALVLFLVFVYVFTESTRRLADATEPPLLVPDVESSDPRRGFQRLGRVAEEIIFACGCAFLAFWFSRLQNLYLQSKATSLWEYFRGDLGTSELAFDWTLFVKALADTGGIEFSSVMVIIGAIVIIGICIGVPLHTLRRAATTARDTARELAARRPRLFARKCSDEEIAKSLNEMVVWPIAYPRVNELLFWLAFALLSLVFYRIGVAFVLIWAWRLAKKAFEKIGKSPEPAAESVV